MPVDGGEDALASSEQVVGETFPGAKRLGALLTHTFGPGESVAIFGASGGVGHMTVQLAKRIGARVLGVESGSDGVRL